MAHMSMVKGGDVAKCKFDRTETDVTLTWMEIVFVTRAHPKKKKKKSRNLTSSWSAFRLKMIGKKTENAKMQKLLYQNQPKLNIKGEIISLQNDNRTNE